MFVPKRDDLTGLIESLHTQQLEKIML